MAIQEINIGSIANDGTGDDLRSAFEKVNSNFSEINSSVGIISSPNALPGTNVTRDSSANIYVNKAFFKNSFATTADLPTAGNYPGMFVYVQSVSAAYYSDGNAWKKLPGWDSTGLVTDGVLRWNGSSFVSTDTGVISINNKKGVVVLDSADITGILGYVPMSGSGGEIGPYDVIYTGTGAVKLPSGLTAQRPITPRPGMIRYNNQNNNIEAYIGPEGSVSWQVIGPLGSAPAVFSTATITNGLTAATVTAVNVIASTGINGALGTTTPAAATVTSLSASGVVTVTATTPTTGAGTGALVVTGGGSIGGNLYVGGSINFNGSDDSSSVTTGALVTAGGAGIAKKVFIGGITTINSTEQSNATTQGALVVGGGIGLAKNLYVGGILNVAGASVLAGTLSVTGDVTLPNLTASKIVFTDGSKKLTSTGSIGVDQGGTGLSAYVLGDVIYANGTTSLTTLAGNTTATKKFLVQTGTGTVSDAPTWGTIANSDISSLLFKDYATSVASPTVAQTTSNSIHGFNAYSSTDFPGNYYTGWTVKSSLVGAQLAVGWDVDNGTAAVVTGSISGNRLTVISVTSGTISAGQLLFGTNILAHSYVTAFISGSSGGAGIYLISRYYPTVVTAQTITTYAGRIKPDVWVRSNDDTGDGANWSEWDRVITAYSRDADLAVNNLFTTGFIQPSNGNSNTNGIIFPSDPGGGSGDAATIQYYSVSGEQAELVLSVANDGDDNIRLSASGIVYVDRTLDVTQRRYSFSTYSTAITASSTVALECATGDTMYITSSVAGSWTANLVNLNLAVNKIKNIRMIITQGATPYVPALQIASSAQSINWLGGSLPGGNANKKDIVEFEIMCTASNVYTVFGKLTTFG